MEKELSEPLMLPAIIMAESNATLTAKNRTMIPTMEKIYRRKKRCTVFMATPP